MGKFFQEDDSIFKEDDQAPLLEIIRKSCPAFFKDEKSPDGKPLTSHSFEIIDLSKDTNIMETKFLIGDTVITGPGIFYKIITIGEKKKSVGVVLIQEYGGIRMQKRNWFMPDRRFMYIKPTKDVIGRFTVFPLLEHEIALYRRVVGERTKEFIPEKKN